MIQDDTKFSKFFFLMRNIPKIKFYLQIIKTIKNSIVYDQVFHFPLPH